VYELGVLAAPRHWQSRLMPTWPEFAAPDAMVYRITDSVAPVLRALRIGYQPAGLSAMSLIVVRVPLSGAELSKYSQAIVAHDIPMSSPGLPSFGVA
jgi:hypothetical protein